MEQGEALAFKEALEIRLDASHQPVMSLLRTTAAETTLPSGQRFYVAERENTEYGHVLYVHIRSNEGEGAIGFIQLLPLGDNRTLVRVPPGRGVKTPSRAYELDPAGRLFSIYLKAFVQQAQKIGLITSRRRFNSASVLDTAARQLASAEDPHGYASVGSVCRSALIALANEVYQSYMLPDQAAEPKGDDADTKLKYVAHHYTGGHSHRQQQGLDKVIVGSWNFASALAHRKNARRQDAEICIILVTAVFDSFPLLIPND